MEADFIPPQAPAAETSPFVVDDSSDFSSDPVRDSVRRPVAPDMGGLPTDSIANAKADSQRDDMFRFLRGAEGAPTDNRSLIDAIDAGKADSDEAISGDIGIRKGLYFPETYAPEVDSLNRRALDFLKSDMYTPPEEIYDLGPRGRLKYEEASDDEFTTTADRLAREQFEQENRMSGESLDALDVAADARRRADAAISRKISNDQPEDPNASTNASIGRLVDQSMDFVDGLGSLKRERADLAAAFDADETAVGRMGEVMPFEETALGKQQAAEAFATSTGTGSGSGSGSGGAGFGSMDSRIAQMLSSRQKEAESDKWMALAQTGMALMASKNPTFGGALGEAGLAGVGALQKSKQGARAFETDMLKLQTQLDIAQQRARSSGSRAKSIPATALTNAYTMVTDAQERLNNASSPAEKFSASQDLEIAQGRFLQIQNRFDSQYGVLPTAAGSGRKQV